MIRRHSRKWHRSLFLVLASALSGCGSKDTPVAETPPPPVTISQPVVRNVIDYDDYEGRIGAEKVEVRSRARGHLAKVNFEAGQIVKKGDLLYEIDPRQYKAALDGAEAQRKAAEASLEFARAEYARTAKLVRDRAASREELDLWTAKQTVAKGDVLKADAAVKQAQLDLDFTKITAEVGGKLGRTQVDQGNLVNAGGGETLLTTLVSVDPMYVYFNVDERSLLRYRERYRKELKAGKPQPSLKELKIPVYVALDGEKGYPHEGVIDFADNRVNPSTGTIEVRGRLSNTERLFDDGMRARVRVPVSDPSKALLLAERAIGNQQGRKFVFVVNDQNEAERRDVTLGQLDDGLLVIRDGLKPEEWVVVNGIQRVRDGMKVQPKRVPMPGSTQAAAATVQPPKN